MLPLASAEVTEVLEYFARSTLFRIHSPSMVPYSVCAGHAAFIKQLSSIRYRKIVELENGRIFALHDQNTYVQNLKICEFVDQTRGFLSSYLPASFANHRLIAQQIVADMTYIVLHRIFEGRSDTFHERLLSIYQAGLMTCGWEGKYPAGRMIAYGGTRTERAQLLIDPSSSTRSRP
jgi:hypothetical protein